MGLTAAIVGGGAASATMSVMGGNAQAKGIKQKAEYDAQVYEQQAAMVLEKKKIQDYQFNRQAAQVRGSIISKTAGKGLLLSGSPAAILADNESQMQFDKAIQDYNLDVERNYALSGATNTRQQGAYNANLAKATGYTNAFSTMLNTASTYGMMNLKMKNPLATGGTYA
jgi:hypothetical protein